MKFFAEFFAQSKPVWIDGLKTRKKILLKMFWHDFRGQAKGFLPYRPELYTFFHLFDLNVLYSKCGHPAEASRKLS
jgi:hypothetical protein